MAARTPLARWSSGTWASCWVSAGLSDKRWGWGAGDAGSSCALRRSLWYVRTAGRNAAALELTTHPRSLSDQGSEVVVAVGTSERIGHGHCLDSNPRLP
eukprot:scaffold7591_cov132-Isochrysis_galbana.AAC.2